MNDVLPAKISLESLKWLLRVARDASNSGEAFIVDGSQNPSDHSWTDEDQELLTSSTTPSPGQGQHMGYRGGSMVWPWTGKINENYMYKE